MYTHTRGIMQFFYCICTGFVGVCVMKCDMPSKLIDCSNFDWIRYWNSGQFDRFGYKLIRYIFFQRNSNNCSARHINWRRWHKTKDILHYRVRSKYKSMSSIVPIIHPFGIIMFMGQFMWRKICQSVAKLFQSKPGRCSTNTQFDLITFFFAFNKWLHLFFFELFHFSIYFVFISFLCGHGIFNYFTVVLVCFGFILFHVAEVLLLFKNLPKQMDLSIFLHINQDLSETCHMKKWFVQNMNLSNSYYSSKLFLFVAKLVQKDN